MATGSNTKKPCCKCNKGGATFTCDGCHQSFCLKHASDHREELSQEMDNIGQQHDILKQDVDQQNINKTLLAQIDRWEKESIEKIRLNAEKARADLKRLTEDSKTRLNILLAKLSHELRKSRPDDAFTEEDIYEWKIQLKNLRDKLDAPSDIKLTDQEDSCSCLRLIMIKSHDQTKDDDTDSIPQRTSCAKGRASKVNTTAKLSQDDLSATHKSQLPVKINTSTSSAYPSIIFGSDPSSDQSIRRLFIYLMSLPPMDKNGPMSGKCSRETDQMERFLTDKFGFKNIPEQYIVQGVKSFQLRRWPHTMDPKTLIEFPYNSPDSFAMTVQEINEWQRSYRVYTGKSIKGMTKDFLHRALQGQSKDGEEAFRMKFVIRISTCPILMEFDGKLISRKLTEDWPNRIKLVSVTGVDFAGRKHDVGDIIHYVSNWRDVFEVDITTDTPALLNERDFCRKRDRAKAELSQRRFFDDLKYMARLRLRACDTEGVQIVVETGIGLGVFAGEHIGIAEQVQMASAIVIRSVLQDDGPTYKHIRGVVFALPVLHEDTRGRTQSCFSDFIHEFQEPAYNGPIPVLIADQDMHRLTVAIARLGFVVSQLNPADSHGVLGEYWQNREPAVEEKLALTTLGLLVQHHLINREVLNLKYYHLI